MGKAHEWERIDYMMNITEENFQKWADEGEYSAQDIIDLHKEALRLHGEVARLQKEKDEAEGELESDVGGNMLTAEATLPSMFPSTRTEAIHFFEVLVHANNTMGHSLTIPNTILIMAELITNDFNNEYRANMKIDPIV